MKLTLQNSTTQITIETEYTPALTETVEHMYRLCVCSGFSPTGAAEEFVAQGNDMLEAEKDAELATEKHRLLIALHEAINRPKGIVPHEAEEFYEQDFYSNNSAQ